MWHHILYTCSIINPFVPNASFLYPPKTSENCNVEKGYRKGALGTNGLRESTRKKYNPYLQKWHICCQESNINPVTPNITNVSDSLSNLYDQSRSYSAIKSSKKVFFNISSSYHCTQHFLITLLCHNTEKVYLI